MKRLALAASVFAAALAALSCGLVRIPSDPCRAFPPGKCPDALRPTPTPTPPTPAPCPDGSIPPGGHVNQCPPEPTATPSPAPTPSPTPIAPPTPSPGPSPTPVASGPPPVLTKFKIGGHPADSLCRRATGEDRVEPCCQNPESGPRFQHENICEVGSTELLDYADPTLQGRGGPCDPEHFANWSSFCLFQDWDVIGGPAISCAGALSCNKASNPFHTDVHFEPGRCFTICASLPPGAVTTSGHALLSARGDGAPSCATHCY